MKRLSAGDRTKVLHLLCEGNSIRATTRITGISKTTILKLLQDAGEAAIWYQDRVLQNLPCEKIQIDEAWGFVGCKQANRAKAKIKAPGRGDAWLWVVTCADTKLVPTF